MTIERRVVTEEDRNAFTDWYSEHITRIQTIDARASRQEYWDPMEYAVVIDSPGHERHMQPARVLLYERADQSLFVQFADGKQLSVGGKNKDYSLESMDLHEVYLPALKSKDKELLKHLMPEIVDVLGLIK